MLHEVKSARQIPGEPIRRWFYDSTLDLIVWLSPDQEITGFQLCYPDGAHQKALTWRCEQGFKHETVDDGEGRPFRAKMTPVLIPDGVFRREHLLALFEDASKAIDSQVAKLVTQTIEKYAK